MCRQDVRLPQTRYGQHYSTLAVGPEAAASATTSASPGVLSQDVAIVPVSLTFVGLRDLVDAGSLDVVDQQQYHLFGALQSNPPADRDGNAYYFVHPEFYLPSR